MTGEFHKFLINATCRSPNNDTEINSTLDETVDTTSTTLSPLDPGTFCNVTIVVVINNVKGRGPLHSEDVFQELPISTKESAPQKVELVRQVTFKDAILLTWSEPPNPNGIIRKYKTLIIDEYLQCLKAIIVYTCDGERCTDNYDYSCESDELQEPNVCEDTVNTSSSINTSVLEQNTSGLHPYRNYSIKIQGFTKCWGEVLSTRLQTNISVPISSPILENVNSTESSIELYWKSLNEKVEGNGPITKYTLITTYFKHDCSDASSKQENRTNIASANTIKLENLRPYWNYSIQISASTEAGEGPLSEEKTYRTQQSNPGQINELDITNTTNATEAQFNWLPPCPQNGIITGYEVNVISIDKDYNNIVNSTVNTTSASITKLDPYSNYTLKVRAFTSVGPGKFNVGKPFRTEVGMPKQPRSVKTESDNFSTLLVTWKAPELYTGPTKYTVTATDTESLTTETCETGYNFNATNCLLDNLDAFWNYTIQVTAETTAGVNGSDTVPGTTAESTPGNVTNVQLKPEEEVTKPRTLTVSWEEPKKRDLNGILREYHIRCTKIDDKSVVYSNRTASNIHSCVMTDIQPGNYDVQVFAATVKGYGSRVTRTAIVLPGAPLKLVEETENNLLMQQSQVKPADDERQIAVKLPLKDLLCNIRNGKLTRWGVIVAQESQATDKPFSGSTTAFDYKVSNTYKSWFQVKDMDRIPPYIATPRDWKVQCLTFYGGNRRKREATTTEHNYTDFVVGEDGKCSGVQSNQYCNGDLQPGRSYRVKSFVCTEGGCTETEYSKAISTAPDLTVPIAAGISSALVVIAVVGVVVFVLRRKQLVCFAKDDESLRTHTPGEGIHMDKIEPTRKNAFRQGPIKLSDFPDAVEKMHKDSDLLFADAYKMLKEKSPNHPMTAAEQQCCRPKNRYTNILPFDHSRVKLRPSDDMEGSDYINANYIPGYTSRREYIATQGAMQATFDDFWRMIWEQNVDTIVMLTKLMEKGRHKCDKYWPDLGEPVFYGDLVVSLQSESNLSDYTIKIFEVKMKEERKMVRHFSYLKWPDMGCPETPELLLEFVKAVRQYTDREKGTTSGPTVVHCSAGVGRTGTFIAVDYLLQHIRDHDEVDIFSLVLEMRNHRLNMVQTEDQYVYIHECLKAFITTDEEEEDENEDEHLYVNTSFGAQEENIYENSGYQKD